METAETPGRSGENDSTSMMMSVQSIVNKAAVKLNRPSATVAFAADFQAFGLVALDRLFPE